MKLVLFVIMGVIIAFYAGAMLNFFPFIGDDLTIKAIGFCTLIICTVVAVCTHFYHGKNGQKVKGTAQEIL